MITSLRIVPIQQVKPVQFEEIQSVRLQSNKDFIHGIMSLEVP